MRISDWSSECALPILSRRRQFPRSRPDRDRYRPPRHLKLDDRAGDVPERPLHRDLRHGGRVPHRWAGETAPRGDGGGAGREAGAGGLADPNLRHPGLDPGSIIPTLREWIPDQVRDDDEEGMAPGATTIPRPLDGQSSKASCPHRSEEHTSELQSLMRSPYAVFCLKKNTARIKVS